MKTPSSSPYVIPELVCTECGNSLRHKIERQNNGKLVAGNQCKFFCDTCQYGLIVFLEFASTTGVAYEPKVPTQGTISGPVNAPKKEPANVA